MASNTLTPLAEDDIITTAAQAIGIHDVIRRRVIEVDERALPDAYKRKAVDWAKVRHALLDGIDVPGVRMTDDFEYILRRAKIEETSDGNLA